MGEKRLSNQQQRRRYNYYNQLLAKPRKPGNEEQKVRMYYKSGNATMLICKNITALSGTSLGLYIERFCKKHSTKLEGKFIFTH